MIGWHTDNSLSSAALESIPGIELRHVKEFYPHNCKHIFYGLLRGCSRAIHILAHRGIDAYYIDNGYFDALYIDSNKRKDMSGKFRVVKNGMHEVYPHDGVEIAVKRVLVLPPSPYSANFYDTTPEDWIHTVGKRLTESGVQFKIRHKDSVSPLEESLAWCDGVLSFNSMTVMKAVEMGKAVMDTHGVFRKPCFANYSLQDLRDFYEPKQFTLEEFRSSKCAFI